VVLREGAREAAELLRAGLDRGAEPRIERGGIALPDEACELLRERVRCGGVRVSGYQLVELALLGGAEGGARLREEPAGVSGRERPAAGTTVAIVRRGRVPRSHQREHAWAKVTGSQPVVASV
jgi:hypothetical protein